MWSSGIDIIQAINNRWELALQPSITEEELVQALAARINHLIVHDFPRLIHILYVIDVSEEKLKTTQNIQRQRCGSHHCQACGRQTEKESN